MNINNPEELRRNLQDFIKIGILYYKEEEGLRFFESVFRYILSATNIEAETVADSVKTETARKLRDRNMAAGEIAEITGLSIEEIEKIPK